MSEVDFRTASLDDILSRYLGHGCVLLRNFAKVDRLTELIRTTDEIYATTSDGHLYPRDLRNRDLPQFHEYIFGEKHDALLAEVFGSKYWVSEDTATRRIDSAVGEGQWQPPLGPHLDAFIHAFAFTVNFWIPFRDCGVDAPSLAAVPAPFAEVLEFSGYTEGPEAGGPAGEWNFPRFDRSMWALAGQVDPVAVAQFRAAFADRIWTPTYALGDAMMLSNWTLHFTHASPNMTARRGNVELRFRSDQTLAEVLDRHARKLPIRKPPIGKRHREIWRRFVRS